MKALEILEKAREKLSDPARWTKNAMARNAAGDRLHAAQLELATCYCSVGAIRAVAPHDDSERGDAAYLLWQAANEGVEDEALKRVIAGWNDAPETTHADVLRVFDHAIQMTRAEMALSEAV